MSTILNDRDVLLGDARVRFLPPADRAVLLGASANSFRIPVSGSGSPATITLSAVVLNMTGNVQWTVTPTMPMAVSGNQADVKLADMTTDSVVVNASMTLDGVKYEASQTIFKTYDGKPGGMGTSTGLVYAYKRAATAPNDNPGAVTYSFPQGQISTPATDALANGWTKSIPTGTEPLYVCVASASATGDTDAIAASEWAAPVMLAQSGNNGTNGLNAATVFLYRRTTTNIAPARPTGTVTYTFATGVATGMDSSWTQSVPPDSGGSYLWITTATATATASAKDAIDTIAASEWASVQLMAKNGETGVSNAVVYAYKRATAAPTDNPGAVTYSFAQASIVTAVLAGGWAKTIPPGSDPLYVAAASASGAGATDDIAATEWAAPVMLAQSGNNGLNTATVFIYRRTLTNAAPAKPGATVTYTFATAVASGMDGGWTQSVPPDTVGDYLWVTTATAAAKEATDTIAATEWAAVRLMAKNGYGNDGQRGTVDVVASISGIRWPANTYDANDLFHSTGYYDGPYNRDRMTLTNGAGFSETRFYDGGTWKPIAAWINGNMVVSGTLSCESLSADTMTGQVYQTDVAGDRVIINEGKSNTIRFYRSSNMLAQIGGGTGNISATAFAGVPAIYAYGDTGSMTCVIARNVSGVAISASGLTISISASGTISVDGKTGDAITIEGGANGIVQNRGGANYLNTVNPNKDNAATLGSSEQFRWNAIYATSSVITTSDVRTKKNIEDSALGLDFINMLRPVSYRQIVARNVPLEDDEVSGPVPHGQPAPSVRYEPRPGVRKHYGFLAQEVREALVSSGTHDAAIWSLADPKDDDSLQALRYEELIAPLVKSVQELSTRLHAQQQEINQLKEA